MEEDIAVKDDTRTDSSADNNVIIIDDETHESKSKHESGSPTDTIYIDDNSEAENEVVRPKVDFSHTQFPWIISSIIWSVLLFIKKVSS